MPQNTLTEPYKPEWNPLSKRRSEGEKEVLRALSHISHQLYELHYFLKAEIEAQKLGRDAKKHGPQPHAPAESPK